MYKINTCNLEHDELIKEPLNDIVDKILASDKNKIVLSGRGNGKTTILNYLEKIGYERDFIPINMMFEPLNVLDEKIYSEKFIRHYYELVFSKKLIQFMNNNYNDIYNKYFISNNEKIDNKIHEFNGSYNKNLDIKSGYAGKFEYVSEIIPKIIYYLKKNDLILSINRFEYTNGGSELSQKILSEYFDYFSKTILTCDDDVESNNYEVYKNQYNIEIIQEIVRKRLELYNSLNSYNNKQKINYNIFNELTNINFLRDIYIKVNGNIKTLLSIIQKIVFEYEYGFYTDYTKVNDLKDKYIIDEIDNYIRTKNFEKKHNFYL